MAVEMPHSGWAQADGSAQLPACDSLPAVVPAGLWAADSVPAVAEQHRAREGSSAKGITMSIISSLWASGFLWRRPLRVRILR